MNKYTKILGLVALLIASTSLVGCNVSDKVATVVENTYNVVQEGNVVVGIITDKLTGSDVWNDIETYVASLSDALDAISTTLERVAPLVGADLTPKDSVVALDPTGTAKLDAATERLLQSIE